ncbi:MAG TPA: 50S ribosomal protein L25 [Acidimicrobiales bacterium]|nr:50S ribosomal protein L25 [Acidimicrobiales bacterium]
MPDITLVAETGRVTGSRASRRLRREGKIPGILYGHGAEPVGVAVDGRELRGALNTEAGTNALLTLKVAGEEHLTMAKVLQRDPVRNTVTHVDFQIVRRDEIVSSDVAVVLVGESDAVKAGDGVIEHSLYSLAINSTPGRIPNQIEVDISGMEIGDTIRVGDLRLPEGVTTDVDPDEPIVVAQPPQVSELDLISEADAEKLEELAEATAEAAEQAEGEAAAEGGETAEG